MYERFGKKRCHCISLLILTLYEPTPENGQTHSNNLSANLRRIVWVCLTILWACLLRIKWIWADWLTSFSLPPKSWVNLCFSDDFWWIEVSQFALIFLMLEVKFSSDRQSFHSEDRCLNPPEKSYPLFLVSYPLKFGNLSSHSFKSTATLKIEISIQPPPLRSELWNLVKRP